MGAPSGEGAVRCMKMALKTKRNEINYINTHGTSTPVGDITELDAIKKTFQNKIPKISSIIKQASWICTHPGLDKVL